MEAEMKSVSALVIVAGLAVASCDQDPARAVRIAARPPAAVVPADGTAKDAASAPATPNVAGVPAPVATPSAAPGSPPGKEAPPAVKSGSDLPAAASSAAKVPGAVAPAPSAERSPPAKKVALAAAGAAPGAVPSGAGLPVRESGWRPQGCPPPPEDGPGPSSLKATGPCTFQHQGAFTCEGMVDDLYISMSRKAANGATLMAFINVEQYKGPGHYKGAQMFVGIQDKSSIYRWSSDEVEITVGPDEEYAIVPTTKLEAEPVLVDCTGPMDNYQCSGRGDAAGLLGTVTVVSGKLQCEGGGTKK
jgi:hypothetical protein